MEGFEERLSSLFQKSFLSSCRECSASWGLEAGCMTKHRLQDVPEPGSHVAPHLLGATAEASAGRGETMERRV